MSLNKKECTISSCNILESFRLIFVIGAKRLNFHIIATL